MKGTRGIITPRNSTIRSGRSFPRIPPSLDSQGYDKMSVLWYRTKFTAPEKHGHLTLFFGEIDGATEVYVNGTKIPRFPPPIPAAPQKASKRTGKEAAKVPASPEKPAAAVVAVGREGLSKSRSPFEVDVTDAIHAGENGRLPARGSYKMTDLSWAESAAGASDVD